VKSILGLEKFRSITPLARGYLTERRRYRYSPPRLFLHIQSVLCYLELLVLNSSPMGSQK